VLEFLDVKTLCRTEQVMTNVYALMAWFEALQGLESVALSAWPHYTSEGKFAGLRWSMNRRVELHKVTIEKVVVPGGGEFRDKGAIFFELCKKKAWTDIACMLVETKSIDAKAFIRVGEADTTPLMLAAHDGCLDVAEALLKAEALIDKTEKGGLTPLITASGQGHVDVARLLVDSGADIDKADKNRCTPLHAAILHGQLEVARLLVDSGADLDKAGKDGITPLHAASLHGQVDVARLLVDGGADIDKVADSGLTALTIARSFGHTAIVKLLLEAGPSKPADIAATIIKAAREKKILQDENDGIANQAGTGGGTGPGGNSVAAEGREGANASSFPIVSAVRRLSAINEGGKVSILPVSIPVAGAVGFLLVLLTAIVKLLLDAGATE
jgi:ankyrin repeat protein